MITAADIRPGDTVSIDPTISDWTNTVKEVEDCGSLVVFSFINGGVSTHPKTRQFIWYG